MIWEKKVFWSYHDIFPSCPWRDYQRDLIQIGLLSAWAALSRRRKGLWEVRSARWMDLRFQWSFREASRYFYESYGSSRTEGAIAVNSAGMSYLHGLAKESVATTMPGTRSHAMSTYFFLHSEPLFGAFLLRPFFLVFSSLWECFYGHPYFPHDCFLFFFFCSLGCHFLWCALK